MIYFSCLLLPFSKIQTYKTAMAFNPFNLFKGNPKVLELMNSNRNLDELLLEEAFVSQFKKSDNETLQTYMNYERYAELISYITTIECDQSNKNRAFKHNFAISQIPIFNNELTYKFLLEEVVFTEEAVEEEVQVEKEIDSESSDRSYSSIKSNNSSTSKKETFENKQYVESDKQNFIIRDENDKTLADYDFKQDKDICEQDFPDVRQKKVIVVRQLVKRTVKKPYEPLVFKLLRYFQAENVIHILDGYVCRVLDSLINNKFTELLSIIDKYQAFNKIKRIFSHLESNSVQESLLNFINKLQECQDSLALSEEIIFIEFIQNICEIPTSEWSNKESELEEKAYVLSLYCSIVEKISNRLSSKLGGENEKSEEKKDKASIKSQIKELAKIIRAEHISKLIQILASTMAQMNAQFLPKIRLYYCKLIKYILKSYSIIKNLDHKYFECQQDGKTVKEINQSCEDCFDPIIQISYTYIFEDLLHMDKQDLKTYKPQNSLISKMEFIEILGILAKENIYFSKRTIIDHPHFDYLLKIMDLYPKGSILHNGILNIITPFLNSQNENMLIEKLLRKKEFFSFLFQTVKADSQLRYEKKDKNRKCYIAQITSICLALEKMQAQDIQQLNEYKQGYEWQFIHECLIQDEKGLRKKVLGGHQKLRDKKPQIFFSKQACLDHFKYFLSGFKLNMFDDFQNYQPNNSDSQQEKDHEAREKDKDFSTLSTKVDSSIEQGKSPKEDNGKYFAEDYIL